MSIVESIDFSNYSDDELRQQYSLTYKIRLYYESCLEKETESKQSSIYTLLLKQATIDLADTQKELEGRGCEVPTVSVDAEEVSTAKQPEKNEEPPADEDLEQSHGQVSYESPLVVRKLKEDTC